MANDDSLAVDVPADAAGVALEPIDADTALEVIDPAGTQNYSRHQTRR